MMKLVVLLTALMLAGCGTASTYRAAESNWAMTVAPVDPVPTECVVDTLPPPKMADAAHDARSGARAYQKLKNQYTAEGHRADRCRLWARGQR